MDTGSTDDKPVSGAGFFPKPLFCFCTRFLLQSTGIYWAHSNIFGANAIPSGSDRKKNFAYKSGLISDLGSRPRKIDLTPRMSNFIPSPNPSKSPLWNVLKVTLEPSDHLVWSWGPPGGHGLVGHLIHFQIFLVFFRAALKKILFMEGGP